MPVFWRNTPTAFHVGQQAFAGTIAEFGSDPDYLFVVVIPVKDTGVDFVGVVVDVSLLEDSRDHTITAGSRR